ncbi:MAG: hypothetical protein M0D57_16035 [Sphingobacteriales bacterium JAD_PAG50586_3]|nr:MAG: hypothetical protein M0D57_16035 [Sphingobacteriales bacterium JAD_PAG50586_3]
MQVTVPQPCSEKWDNMTPLEQANFCGTCQTCVVDFTLFSDIELVSYLKNAKGKICGRFDDSQMNRELEFEQPYRNHTGIYKLAAGVALFAGLSYQANAHTVVKPAIEWVEKDKFFSVVNLTTIADEPVPKDNRIKYVNILAYSDAKFKRLYNGKLKVIVSPSRFIVGESTEFKHSDDNKGYRVKVPDSLVGQNIYIRMSDGKHNWDISIDGEDYTTDDRLTPFIINGDVGVITSIALYDRHAKKGIEKLWFWQKKKNLNTE